ncbi:hypothetical protein BS17DRAFT_752460 [Gyrodon lividus]|nr:hypothetical protein BS17DRAFT_752460 [Gyrodon lividus]
MQWAASRAARGVLSQTRVYCPLAPSLHSLTALAHLRTRSIFSSCFIRSSPLASLKHRHSHTDEPIYKGLLDPSQPSHLSQPSLPSHTSHPQQPSETLQPPESPESHHAPEYNFFHPPPTPPVESSLSSARLSIIAANAVRQVCNSGAFRDAHYIINSLHYSLHPDTHRPEPLKLPFLPNFEFVPITFDKPISPRLAAHALLHHMIRKESPLKAYETAQTLMRNGIQFREVTLLRVTEALLQAPPTVFSVLKEKGRSMFRPYSLPDHLPIIPEDAKDDGLRFALTLLLRARGNNQRCSDRAFETLVSFCLMQGEIIMGSLLFVLLVKDFEIRGQKAQQIKAKITEQEAFQGAACSKLLNRWQDHTRSRIPPNRLLKAITHRCEEELTYDSDSEEGKTRRAEALQALANLAGLIHSRSLPYSDISHLLRALYSCPKVPDKVMVMEDGKERLINAHRYFHHVVLCLANRLPTKRGKDPPDRYAGKQVSASYAMPPFSRETYNTIVHYALRHRLSVSLAQSVLHHMEHVRRPGLKPDIITYNIIVRSGTLLRRNDMVTSALEELRKLKENRSHGIMVQPDRPAYLSNHGSVTPKLSNVLAVSPMSSNIAADVFTLTSYITHLTSTGNPHVVASILFHVIPELSIVDHPAWGDNPPSAHERAIMAHRTRQERLHRAVFLGPWFFTSVLNALCKAGKTGLAERVWLLAKQAEKASWVKRGTRGPEMVQGWCLPVHAYTIMMQLYAIEARNGLLVRARLRGAPNPRDSGSGNWQPKTPYGKERVKGWAYYVLARDAIAKRHRSRRTLGLRMGTVLYRSMFRAAKDVYDSLTRLMPSSQPQVYQLQPDARFFNAALAMFGRQPGMVRRAAKTGPAHWRQKEGRATIRYSRRGTMPRKWNPFLKRIVQEMLGAGCKLPEAFKRLFVGSWAYESFNRPGRPVLNRQPLGFPVPRKKFLAHALQTHKDRGLPVQRSEWKQAGHKWRHWRRRRKWSRRKRVLQRT